MTSTDGANGIHLNGVKASDANPAKPKTIILWVHPRSVSTAFECAFLQRQDEFDVKHEPMGEAWYFGPERLAPRFPEEVLKSKYSQHHDMDFAKSWKHATQPDDGRKRVFSKDMAQYILPHSAHPSFKDDPRSIAPSLVEFGDAAKQPDGNPTVIPSELLLDPNIVHTFLIRTPAKAVPSYYRLCSGDKCTVTGFEYFDPEEVGLREVRALYEFIRRRKGYGTGDEAEVEGEADGIHAPLILDSADVLNNPTACFKKYCDVVGVDFRESMLEWKSGEVSHFQKWAGWHTDAQNSTGLGKKRDETLTDQDEEADSLIRDAQAEDIRRRKEEAKKAKEASKMPDIVRDTVKATLPDYDWLAKRAWKPDA